MPRDLTRIKPSMETETAESTTEATPRRSRVTKEAGSSPISSGWSVDRRSPVTKGDKPDKFTVSDDGEESLIAFLESTPFASFFQHWILVDSRRQPRVCLGDDCPLCDIGDRPKSADYFNVILITSDEPKLQVWYATADPAAAIKERADNKRTSPLNKPGLYFAVSKRKAKNDFFTYSVDPVKEDELEADWGVLAITDEQISKLAEGAYTAEIVKVHSKSELRELAGKLAKD
jgi:hypothetical protein